MALLGLETVMRRTVQEAKVYHFIGSSQVPLLPHHILPLLADGNAEVIVRPVARQVPV